MYRIETGEMSGMKRTNAAVLGLLLMIGAVVGCGESFVGQVGSETLRDTPLAESLMVPVGEFWGDSVEWWEEDAEPKGQSPYHP